MTKRRHQTMTHDESGVPIEASDIPAGERRPKNARTWAIQGLRIDGSGMDVVAEGMTKGQALKMAQQSAPLLKRLYSRVRLVKTVVGDEYTL